MHGRTADHALPLPRCPAVQDCDPTLLLGRGMPLLLLEQVFALSGQGWMAVNYFLAHIALVAGSLSNEDEVGGLGVDGLAQP